MNLSARALLRDALRDFRRTFPQLIVTDVLVRAVVAAILIPGLGLVVEVLASGRGVVTDVEIAGFLLHPAGIAALLAAITVGLGAWLAEIGALAVIGSGACEDRRVTWLEACRFTLAQIGGIAEMAWYACLRLWIALPFVAALGCVYWFLLRQHDINYFLAGKPPEFLVAAVIAGFLLTGMAVVVIRRLAGWLLALPMVLFEGIGGREALRSSDAATAAMRGRIAWWLCACLALVALASMLATLVVRLLGDLLVPHGSSDLTLLLLALGAVIAAGVFVNVVIAMVATTLFPLLVVRLYRALGGTGSQGPTLAAPGSLGSGTSWFVPGKAVLAGAAGAVLVVAVGGYAALRSLDVEREVRVIAHRGGAAVAPENTMAAFRRGIAAGADWLELDVQENADGTVIVAHDRDFMKAAGVDLEVWRATDAALSSLDIGSAFGPEFAGERVPTLREVLELARGRAGVVIELKYYGHDTELEKKVIDLVEATGMESEIVIMSLEQEGLRKAAALRPEWTYGLLNTVAIGDVTTLDVGFLALSAPAASHSMIRRAHGRDLAIYAWTINDPVQMAVMMSRGVDGIITDRVATARDVVDLYADLTRVGRLLVWIAGEAGLLRGADLASARDDA